MVFLARRRYHVPQPDPHGNGTSGVFFNYRRWFKSGTYALRCHVQAADNVVQEKLGVLSVQCINSTAAQQSIVAEITVPIDPTLVAKGDHLFLCFDLAERTRLDLRGRVTYGLGRIHLRRLIIHAVTRGQFIDYRNDNDQSTLWPAARIRSLMIGTNGVCNACCTLCPTNKSIRAHLPTGVMTMELFQKIVDDIAVHNIEVDNGKIRFGLFGEPLMDRYIVERVRYARERLPHLKVILNTNAAAFNERRHSALVKLVHRFSVHVEAISPRIYAELMKPLRAEVVFPKIEHLISIAPGKVVISVPLSTRNIDQYDELHEYWMKRGVRSVNALGVWNRTTDSLDYYNHAINPTPNACSERIGLDLVIDWDGTVLACCQDFMKREPLGNVNEAGVLEIIRNDFRKRFIETIRQGCWNSLESCRNCKSGGSVQE
jgi:radical SAM protein with 4Fe4S-binding SPASM domain